MSRGTGDDFFGSFESKQRQSSAAAGVRSRKAPPPPPPPPRQQQPTTTATATTNAYYGSSNYQQQSATVSAPIYRQAAPSNNLSSNHRPLQTGSSSTAQPASSTPSYYGNPSIKTTATSSTSKGAPPPPHMFQQTATTTSSAVRATSPPAFQHQQQARPATHLNTANQTTTTTAPLFYGQQPTEMKDDSVSSSSDWYTPTTTTTTTTTATMSATTQDSNPYAAGLSSTLMESSSSLQGAMDTSGRSQTSVFVPDPNAPRKPKTTALDDMDLENEPPLLEELGVNLEHILLKTKAVVMPSVRLTGNSALMDPALIVEDADLAGPLAFCLLLGAELLFAGKIHFGYIYGLALFGCLSMTLVLNLLSPEQAVSVWTVASTLGYALLPVNILALLKVVLVNLASLNTLGRILGILTVVWSTTASTRLLEVGCGMRDQRYLIAYPIALLYSAFVLITIF